MAEIESRVRYRFTLYVVSHVASNRTHAAYDTQTLEAEVSYVCTRQYHVHAKASDKLMDDSKVSQSPFLRLQMTLSHESIGDRTFDSGDEASYGEGNYVFNLVDTSSLQEIPGRWLVTVRIRAPPNGPIYMERVSFSHTVSEHRDIFEPLIESVANERMYRARQFLIEANQTSSPPKQVAAAAAELDDDGTAEDD